VTTQGLILRRVSLAVLAVWGMLVVASFVDRRMRNQRIADVDDVPAHSGSAAERPINVEKGFTWSDTIGGQQNFRLAAREKLEFGDGWLECREVEVSAFHAGQVAYGIVAERARIHPAKKEALVTGNTQLSLQGGITVRADGFLLHGAERSIESQGPVTFAGPGWGGFADRALGTTSDNTLELTGGVSLTWRRDPDGSKTSVILLAPRLRYERDKALLRFPDGLTVLRERVRLHTPAGTFQLSESEGDVSKASLAGPVVLGGFTELGDRIDGEAGDVEFESLPGGRLRFSAEPATETGWVTVRGQSPEAVRELRTWRMVGEGSRSVWEWIEGQGLACSGELTGGENDRQIEAGLLHVTFNKGQAEAVSGRGDVQLSAGERHVRGEELLYSILRGTFTLTARAAGRVLLVGPDIEAECDSIEGVGEDRLAAVGQVSGVLRRGASLPGVAVGDEVRFATQRLTVLQRGASVEMDGEARVWQEERLARADVIEFERDKESVRAKGHVLTSSPLGAGQSPAASVVVRARQMLYERRKAQAVYEGDVVLEDPRARASCQRMTVLLDEKGNVKQADLDGGVIVRELTSPREIRGERARFVVADDNFELWGSPVVVQEPSGNQVKADYLRWLRKTDTVEVTGSQDKPSETLYHPQTPLAHARRPSGRKPSAP
jgi:lipopolysaccharide export system protein LptA